MFGGVTIAPVTVDDAPLIRHELAHRLRTAALASLIPWAAFILTLGLADNSGLDHWFRSIAAAPFYLGFVALPSFLPLAAARPSAARMGALALMTTTAILAAIAIVTTDDAQAGLAVLWIPIVAVPAALVIWVVQIIVTLATGQIRHLSPGGHTNHRRT